MPLPLRWLLAGALLGASACGDSSPEKAQLSSGPSPTASFRNVHLHVTDTVTLEVRYLNGALVSNQPGRPPIFDDQRSFTLRIDSAEIAMSVNSLTHLLNEHVFAARGAPLSHLDVSIENGALKQKGRLHKGISVPFTVVADIGVTSDGQIRLHPTSVKAAGIPSGPLYRATHGRIFEEHPERRPQGAHARLR